MPITHRTHQHADLSTAATDSVPVARLPHRDNAPIPRSRRLVIPRGTDWAWPATIIMIAAIVFVASLILTTLGMALAMALTSLAVGGIVLAMLSGSTWATWLDRLRDRATRPRQH